MDETERMKLALLEHQAKCEERRTERYKALEDLIQANALQVNTMCGRLENGNAKFAEHGSRISAVEEKQVIAAVKVAHLIGYLLGAGVIGGAIAKLMGGL